MVLQSHYAIVFLYYAISTAYNLPIMHNGRLANEASLK